MDTTTQRAASSEKFQTGEVAAGCDTPQARPVLTRDHACLLASQVYTRDADALYYGERGALPTDDDRAKADELYQLAHEAAAEVTGDPEHISRLWDEADAWLRGGL